MNASGSVDVNIQDLKDIAPYDNYLLSAYLSGAHIKEVLEYAVTTSPQWHLCDQVKPSQCAPDGCGADGQYCQAQGAWPQFHGLRWSYNIITVVNALTVSIKKKQGC